MPRGLRVLAGNAARGNEGLASAPSAGGTGPGGESGPDGTGNPPRRSRLRPDKRGAASGAGSPPKSRRGSPAPRPRPLLHSRRCLPGRAPSPGPPAGCPPPPSLRGSWVRATPAAPAPSGGRHRARLAAGLPAVCGGALRVGSGSPVPGENGGQAPSLAAAPGSGVCGGPWWVSAPPRPAPPVRSPRCPGKGAPHGPASRTAGTRAGSGCAPDK
ncbi:basic proline-rich protein-like [Cinclus cinclus]|uniref:basic proline-rich protein-like n=1 Tax=Cinclus cinclus TaxID=127875 RepID=UPI002E0E3466